MSRSLPLAVSPRKLGQVATGLLLASTLAMSAGALHPQYAAAGYTDLPAPTLVSVDRSVPSVAEVTIREKSEQEAGYVVSACHMPDHTYARAGDRYRSVPGQERSATITVDDLDPTAGYCFDSHALSYGQTDDITGPDVFYTNSSASADPPAPATPPPPAVATGSIPRRPRRPAPPAGISQSVPAPIRSRRPRSVPHAAPSCRT